MLFSSPIFLFWFLPLTLLSYYLAPGRGLKNLFLASASVFFYAWGEPAFAFVMLLSVFISYLSGIMIEKYPHSKRKRKTVVFIVLAWHLSIFFVFKYWDFFFGSLGMLFPGAHFPLLHIALPIGISFFTFQSMSYVFDVYRGKGGVAQKNFVNVLLYISLFPQLIAGPIVRYHDIAHEINLRKENLSDFTSGIYRFLCGLSKKVLIANNMAVVADLAFNQSPGDLGILFAWLGAISYFFQIYFDFSAYSDMAIGLGKVFGFHFLENFNYPYISKSMTEFWGRWHISLGNWFKDYVYIPLGGSRGSGMSVFRNLLIVWTLTGFWHGADWTYVVWGLYNFVFVLIEKLFFRGNRRRPSSSRATALSSSPTAIISTSGETRTSAPTSSAPLSLLLRCYVIIVFMLGLVFFRSPSIRFASEYIAVMFSGSAPAISGTAWFYLKEYSLFYIFAAVLSTPIVPWIEKNSTCGIYYLLRNAFIAVVSYISVIYLVKGVYNPFIYFNF